MVGDVIGFVIAIFLGALIGLQREFIQQHLNVKSFAGIRTFIFVTFFGALLGFLGKDILSVWVIVGFAGIFIFSIVSYILTYMNTKRISATTQISFVISFVLGAMCTTGYAQLASIFAIIVATFLTFKERLHKMAKKLQAKELVGMIEFALVAFVVLPLLPNKNYSPMDIPGLNSLLTGFGINPGFLSQLNVLNPHNIWLMVIFISGINLAGYFLVKAYGSKKGYGLLGIVGGMVSSTAVTLSMSEESKLKKNREIFLPFFIATVFASSVMFIRVLVEVSVVNSSLLPKLILPMGAMCVAGFVIPTLLYKRRMKKVSEKEVKIDQPFAFKPALIFGLFFALVLFVAKAMQILLGATGIYITSILSGLVDVDAITLSMSSLSKSGSIHPIVAVIAIVLAAVSNTIVKASMTYIFGNKKFARSVIIGFSVILAIGLLILFL